MYKDELKKERDGDAWRRAGGVATIGNAVVNLIRIFVRD